MATIRWRSRRLRSGRQQRRSGAARLFGVGATPARAVTATPGDRRTRPRGDWSCFRAVKATRGLSTSRLMLRGGVPVALSSPLGTVRSVPDDPLLAGLDEFQLAAVTSPAAPLAILAPAGSGKTRVLTRRIAWRAREGSPAARRGPSVTFPRKAAGELAQRLRRLGVDTQVTAGTFHALALAQLRRRA